MYQSDYFAPVVFPLEGMPVRLAARSFVIPVPEGVGQFMVYPFDIDDQPLMKKGMPILDDGGKPQGRGIVFINHEDGAVQTARGNGEQMIIINAVSEAQAAQLLDFSEKNISNPEKITEEQIHSILRYAREDLGIDDFFDGEQAKIPEFDALAPHSKSKNFGAFIRRSPQERFAILGQGSGAYAGPAGSPQRFTNNVVVLANADHTWMVQTRAFLNTYSHPDKREIKINELPAYRIQEGKAPARHYTA